MTPHPSKNSKYWNALFIATFPVSVWFTNLILGYKFYNWYQTLIDRRIEAFKPMNSEAFFQRSLTNWIRKYPELKKYKFTILKEKFKDYMVHGYNEVELSVRVYKKPESDKWVIISHGWTENKFEVLHIADMYLKLGYNVIIYDARAHGLSSHSHFFSTIGYLEKFDLIELVRWANTEFKAEKIVLHGQSMGAGTSIEAVKIIDPEFKRLIKACVIDGCFDNLYKQELYIAGLTWAINPLFYRFGIRSWVFNKNDFELRDVAPAEFLNYVPTIPFLVIHGDKDSFVRPEMGNNIYNEKVRYEKKKISELFIVPGGQHVESFQINPTGYQKQLKKFLEGKV